VIKPSRYVFEALRKDEKFILYRGRSKDDASQVLVLSPLAEYPSPEILIIHKVFNRAGQE